MFQLNQKYELEVTKFCLEKINFQARRMRLVEVINLFKQIQETSSLNKKKEIITANRDDELFKKCLRFLLDGNIVTGISDSKISKVNQNTTKDNATQKLNSFEDVMEYLQIHNTGRDEDIANIKGFIYDHHTIDDEFMFYVQMITKKYRLGADAKLVNKCIPGLIPTFDVMLGTPIEKVNLKEGTWFSISHKLNGNRCIYYNGEFYTRQGKKYLGLEHIKIDIEKMPDAAKYVFDGELIYKNPDGLSDSESFQKGTGIAQSKNDTKEELKLVLFDILPTKEFEKGVSNHTYRIRKQQLFSLKEFETENFEIVNMFYEGDEQSEIWKWLNYAGQHDMEGIMLSLDAPYECKRTKNLIKFKKFKEIDLRCIDINIATSGKYKGLIGSITCKYGNSTVDVGAGFDDSKRRYYTYNPDKILNHVISIKYKEETKSKSGLKSLQFPIFICCRNNEDKNIADDEVII